MSLKYNNIHSDNEYTLKMSAQNGQLETVKYLVSKGVNIHTEYDYALRISAKNGHLEIVKYLVSLGANINALNKGMEGALVQAVEYGHLEIVKYLVTSGADYNEGNDFIFIHAVNLGHLEIVKYIVSLGVKINVYIETLLRYSLINEHYKITNYLIEQCGEIDIIKNNPRLKYLLNTYNIKKLEYYKGPINDQTEIECGVCLTNMNSYSEYILQCKTCNKCVHNHCMKIWRKNCIYCRN